MSWDFIIIFLILGVFIPWRGAVRVRKLLAQPALSAPAEISPFWSPALYHALSFRAEQGIRCFPSVYGVRRLDAAFPSRRCHRACPACPEGFHEGSEAEGSADEEYPRSSGRIPFGINLLLDGRTRIAEASGR